LLEVLRPERIDGSSLLTHHNVSRPSAEATPGTENGIRKHREVQKVIFNFSNAFSWFTAKDVEFMMIRE